MTVKELREALAKYEDDLIVTDGTSTLYVVSREPSYYDGTHRHVEIRGAPDGHSYYIKGVIRHRGFKLFLRFRDFDDALGDHTDMPIEYECSDEQRARHEPGIEAWRAEAKKIDAEYTAQEAERRLKET